MRTSTRLLGVLSAAALVAMGLLQLKLADLYADRGEHPISLDDQRLALGGLALVLALALLVRPRSMVWAAVLLLTAAEVGLLVYGLNRCWPLSDYDGCFRDDWDVDEVRWSVLAGGAALLLQCFGWVSAVSAAASRVLPSHDALR
jgi:hypothetical protein